MLFLGFYPSFSTVCCTWSFTPAFSQYAVLYPSFSTVCHTWSFTPAFPSMLYFRFYPSFSSMCCMLSFTQACFLLQLVTVTLAALSPCSVTSGLVSASVWPGWRATSVTAAPEGPQGSCPTVCPAASALTTGTVSSVTSGVRAVFLCLISSQSVPYQEAVHFGESAKVIMKQSEIIIIIIMMIMLLSCSSSLYMSPRHLH